MSKKILVVDDDSATLSLLQAFLSAKGLEVHTALDGVDALEKLAKIRPDLIVLDVMMPRMDGYGFLREIRKDTKFRSTPVVVLTAREMLRDVFVQEGVRDYVTKPYDPEDLYKTLSKYL
jgi:CheY-like chemotaxis protein